MAELAFDTVYEMQLDFTWRSLRRLGVPTMFLEDAVQDVFIVISRRLAEFEGRSQLRTWIFSIAMRVAKEYRRRQARRQLDAQSTAPDAPVLPCEQFAQSEAVRLLDKLLDELDEDRRVVFILAELEQMSVPEIALATGANPNTVYTRLRAARRCLNEAIERHRSQCDSFCDSAIEPVAGGSHE